jgi:hypothetical protein
MDTETREWCHTSRELDVGDTDIEGANLTILRGVDVNGHLTWEGKPPGDVQDISVSLQSTDKGTSIHYVQAKADGSFLLKGVTEGAYRPGIQTGSQDCYLKSARYGTAHLVDGKLEIHQGTGTDASLELTMSSRVTHVDGIVLNGDSLPSVGAYVVLIPDAPHRDARWKYVEGTTDQNGKFSLRGIQPGDYKLFGWDSSDDLDWFDADFLKLYEAKGVAVHVEEGERKTVELNLIETKLRKLISDF